MQEDVKVGGKIGMYDPWDMYGRQLTQEKANYNPVGGDQERACSNCQWFLSPDGCVVVQDWPNPIVPNGVSDLWRERVNFEDDIKPTEVVIVGERSKAAAPLWIRVPREAKDRLVAMLTKVVGTGTGPTPEDLAPVTRERPPESIFSMSKDKNGELRWFAVASNNYRDHDYPPEIIEDSAHKEFKQYLETTGNYPELWLHHLPIKWGQADLAIYADGIFAYSGTVDAGWEFVAEGLAETSREKQIGVSHGFKYVYSDPENGIIGWYRTWEISPLLIDKAANPWTGFASDAKEADDMDAEQRAKIVGLVGEGRANQVEAMIATASNGAIAAGAESKEKATPPATAEPAATPPATPPEATVGSDPTTKALEDLTETIAGLTKKVDDATEAVKVIDGVKVRLDQLEKTDDEKVAALFMPQNTAVLGVPASQSSGNVVTGREAEDAGVPEADHILKQVVENLVTGAPIRQPTHQ